MQCLYTCHGKPVPNTIYLIHALKFQPKSPDNRCRTITNKRQPLEKRILAWRTLKVGSCIGETLGSSTGHWRSGLAPRSCVSGSSVYSIERHLWTATTHTVGFKPATVHIWDLHVLWLLSVWRRSSLDQHQRRECADVPLHPFATGALFVQGGGQGRGNNVYGLRAGGAGGGSGCRQLAPPPGPGSVRLRSFDLEWPMRVYIFPKCSSGSSCLCLSWPAVVLVSPPSCSLHSSTCLARLETDARSGLGFDLCLLCFLSLVLIPASRIQGNVVILFSIKQGLQFLVNLDTYKRE